MIINNLLAFLSLWLKYVHIVLLNLLHTVICSVFNFTYHPQVSCVYFYQNILKYDFYSRSPEFCVFESTTSYESLDKIV